MKRLHLLRGLLLCIFLIVISSSAKGELIVNGGFESSVNNQIPDSWDAMTPNTIMPRAFTGNPVVPPSTGSFAVSLGPSGIDASNGGTLSQSFSVPTSGIYTFSFEYTRENFSSELAIFSWSLSGAINDSDTISGIGDGYETFSQSYSISTPGNITVGFTDIIGNGHAVDAVIDNVSFAVTAIPEPSGGVLLAMGMALLAQKRRKTPLSRTKRKA